MFLIFRVIWIGITPLCFSFMGGTIVGLPFKDWLGFTVNSREYRRSIASVYLYLWPLYVIPPGFYVFYHDTTPMGQCGPVFTFLCTLILWAAWGAWSTLRSRSDRKGMGLLNFVICVAVGWAVGVGAAVVSEGVWKDVRGCSWPLWPRLTIIAVACGALLCAYWLCLWLLRRESREASGHEVKFETVTHGDASSAEVALLVSVAGGEVAKVRRATKAGLIYEIRPVGETPSRTLLDSPATLQNFRGTYQGFLSMMEARHPSVKCVECFLAAPAPIAVICGRDFRKDVPPALALFDLVDGEYQKAFTLT